MVLLFSKTNAKNRIRPILNPTQPTSQVPCCTSCFRFPSEAMEDVEFTIDDVERVPIGNDFSITVKAVNKSEVNRTVNIVMTAVSTYYTGAKAHDIARAEGKFILKPSESEYFED
nr:uncharacterized protein LOC128705608 [Cherax quadricarinatus]